MNHFESNSIFNLWSYDVSHSCLLLRGKRSLPLKGIEDNKNLDLFFYATSYIEIKDFFRGVLIKSASKKEIAYLKQRTTIDENTNAYVITSENKRYFIVASSLSIFENELPPLEKYKTLQTVDFGTLIYENITDGAKEFRENHPYAFE